MKEFYSQDTLVYSTFHHERIQNFERKVWVPKSADAQIAIDFLNKKEVNLIVEDLIIDHLSLGHNSKITSINASNTQNKKVILYAQSDTLADSCSRIYNKLLPLGVNVELHVPYLSKERADDYFKKTNLPFRYFTTKRLKEFKPDIFVVLNDWTKEVHRIFAFCKRFKITTVCLQESIIDFGDSKRRMQHADVVLVQGVQTIKELKRKEYYITGNPRYTRNPLNEPGQLSLVNCNFTYGIFEDQRNSWMSDIKDALLITKMPYRITQHPRDKGEIDQFGEVLRSNSQSLPSILKNSKLLITRFSSLIHEALANNVPVIYYNPHGESMKYDFGYNGSFLQYAEDKYELIEALEKLKNYVPEKNEISKYLAIHCIPFDSDASENIASVLHRLPPLFSQFKIKDLFFQLVYYPNFLHLIRTMRTKFIKTS